jgi:hypothetical protein
MLEDDTGLQPDRQENRLYNRISSPTGVTLSSPLRREDPTHDDAPNVRYSADDRHNPYYAGDLSDMSTVRGAQVAILPRS